jgi:hypothetical protein
MENQRPIQTFREGAVGASIWLKESESGTFFDVTFSRSYKNDDTGECGYARTFSQRHLEGLAKVSSQAYNWIEQQEPSCDQEAA